MSHPSLSRPALALSLLTLCCFGAALPDASAAEKYQSRLSQLLIRKADAYLPSRLLLGAENRFVIKAQPGYVAKVFVSHKGEGKVLANGTPLPVGEDVQELSGTVPDSGVLPLSLKVPQDDALHGKVLYVAAVAGPTEEALEPIGLVDSTGRRTDDNVLVISKITKMNGPAVLPGVPGINPQMFNQLTTMGDIYTSGDKRRKELLDNGDVNAQRQLDRNPFINRGIQPGLQPGIR